MIWRDASEDVEELDRHSLQGPGEWNLLVLVDSLENEHIEFEVEHVEYRVDDVSYRTTEAFDFRTVAQEC